jgi:hypothetical protein
MKFTSTFCGKIDAENVLSMVNGVLSTHCVLMFTVHLPRRTVRIHGVFLILLLLFQNETLYTKFMSH